MMPPRVAWLTCTAIAAALIGCGNTQAPSVPPVGTVDAPSTTPIAGSPAKPIAGSSGATGATGAVGAAGATGNAPSAMLPPASAGSAGQTGAAMPTGDTGMSGAAGSPAVAAAGCEQRAVAKGDAQLHFHHVHFNSPDPSKDIEFFMKFYNGMPIDFCKDKVSGEPTHAVKTERAYFLFTPVDAAPDPALNSFIDHVGFANANPTNELRRLMMLNVPLWKPGDQLQCQDVAMGTACFSGAYFYSQAPNGARIEVSNAPGPSTMGFGHTHLRGPLPDFYMQLLGAALQSSGGTLHVDGVNITNTLLENRSPDSPVDTKGKPIDHLAYSTTDIMATIDRIKGAGIKIEEELSFKPAYGFNSFMVKSPQGIWIEIVEDGPFKQ